ncbi:MAG: T9SS type A sorting domain-containing protein [Bacteroidetes bacterium]|nr:T9SS type A sorting domain-containing protein [Bacteroidota bacterium]
MILSKIKYIILLIVTASFLISVNHVKAVPLSGNYTIGSGSGSNFSSFTQAIDTLSTYGVISSVVFLVDTGMFNEQIVIPVISGASATNTITFIGHGDSTLLFYSPSSSNRPVVCFTASSHVIFENIRVEVQGNYGYGFQFLSGADSITVKGCYILLPNNSSTYYCCGFANYSSVSGSGSANTSYVTIENNTIEKGYDGIRLIGSVGSSAFNNINGNTVINFGNIGINVSGNSNMDIIGNSIYSSESGASRAINMWPTGHSIRILKNTVELASTVNHTRVIQVANAPGGGGSSWSQEILVANNIVQYSGSYTSNMTGIYTKHVSYLRVYNNTIVMSSGSGAKSLWFDALSSTPNTVARNNNITNNVSGGELLRVHNQVSSDIDYNNFYNSNGFKVWWKGTTYTNLSSYQSNSSQDANSVIIDPKFVSTSDFHIHPSNVSFEGLGTPVSQITDDIDDENRDASHPDIGADEYASCADLTISDLVSPANCSYLNATATVSAWIKNLDTNAIANIPVSYQIDGGSVIDEIHSSSIAGLDSVLYVFSTKANLTTAKDYTIKAFVKSFADHNPTNDTFTSSITITELNSSLEDSVGTCYGNNLTLQPGYFSGATYLWSDASSDTILVLDTTTAGTGTSTFWVNISGADGCSVSDTVIVFFSAPASISLGNDSSLCTNDTLNLDATFSGASYLWQDNSTQSSFNATISGTYWVDVSTGLGCVVSDTMIATFNALPAFDIGADTSICVGDSIVMDASVNNASYYWQNSSTQSNFKTFNSGTYWVNVTNSFGCSLIDSLTLSVENYPLVNLGSDTTICDGESVLLDATQSSVNYAWQNNSTQATLNASAAGTYWVEVTNSTGCATTDTFILSVIASPVFNLGNDTSICNGDSLILNVTTAGVSYVWQDNSSYPTFTALTTGVYWVELTNSNGCSTRDTINLTVNSLPGVNLGNDKSICDGDELVLNAASSGSTYRWQDNSTNSTFHATKKGVYSVEVTNSFGCINADSMELFIIPLPQVNLGNDTTFCKSNPLILDATLMGANYKWHDNSTKSTFSVDKTGDYWVEVSRNNCKKTDSIHVTINSVPIFEIRNDTTICEGESIVLDVATIYCTYVWQDNSTQGIYKASKEGSYRVTVTNNYQCSITDSVYLTIKAGPLVNLGNDTAICIGESLFLDVTNTASTYLWQDNTTSADFIATTAGLYWVKVTDQSGCINYDSVNLSIDPLPVFNLGNDTAICSGDVVILDATTLNATYLWQDNTTQPSFNAEKEGHYWVKVTSDKACSDYDSLYLTVRELPQAELGNDTAITIQSIRIQNFVLNAKTGYTDYLWSTTSTDEFIEIDTSYGLGKHDFWIRILDDKGCVGYDTITINIIHDIGIDKGESFSMQLYPNPNQGKFVLSLQGSSDNSKVSLFVFDINGKTVFEEELDIKQNKVSKAIDISAYPKGIYTLTIQSKNFVRNVRIITQ